MSGSSIKDIKQRIKSIQGTRQITKAMQLVASSKLKNAKILLESAQNYFEAFNDIINEITNAAYNDCIFFNTASSENTCYCIIAGDRGLAGGYNSNIFKEYIRQSNECEDTNHIIAIGKKTYDFFSKNHKTPLNDETMLSDLNMEDCFSIGKLLTENFLNHEFDSIYLIYTQYKNAIIQNPVTFKILPLPQNNDTSHTRTYVEIEPSLSEALSNIIPEYIASLIYYAAAHSYVSEQSSRSNAMDTAVSNADEMLDKLHLQYNRARQSSITQEITEIVAGTKTVN